MKKYYYEGPTLSFKGVPGPTFMLSGEGRGGDWSRNPGVLIPLLHHAEINMFRKERNRLLSKGMSNIYLKVTIEKK